MEALSLIKYKSNIVTTLFDDQTLVTKKYVNDEISTVVDSLARSDHTHKVELTSNQINLTNNITTTSTNYAIVPGTNIINISAGEYIIFAYLQSFHSANNASWDIGISENLILNTSSITRLIRGGNQFPNVRSPYIYFTRVILNDPLNRIDLVWRTVTAGTITATNRGIVIIRVS